MRIAVFTFAVLLGTAFAEECSDVQYEFFAVPAFEIASSRGGVSSDVVCVTDGNNAAAIVGLSSPILQADSKFYFAMTQHYDGFETEYENGDTWVIRFTKTELRLTITQIPLDNPMATEYDFFNSDTNYVLIYGTDY